MLGKGGKMAQPSLWQGSGLNHRGTICGKIIFLLDSGLLSPLGYGQLVQGGFGEMYSFSLHKECVLGSKGTKYPGILSWEESR